VAKIASRLCQVNTSTQDVELSQMPKRIKWDIAELFSRCMPVPECGCWIWMGRMSSRQGLYGRPGGYAGGYAHRLSWTLHKGPIPRGLLVLHKCDTPSCVNPDHLFIGTHLDNTRDRVSKGRGRSKTTIYRSQYAPTYGVSPR
jgi:hypothetical protein